MKYEIDSINAVRVFQENNKVPFHYQPKWPDGTAWANKAEAENWAEVLIKMMTDSNYEYVTGKSPEDHPRLKPKPLNPETGLPVEET